MCLPIKPFKVEKEWEHAGLLCAVTLAHNNDGHRCGYVRVAPTHVTHGKDYNDVDVSVHGGLTFGGLEPCVEHPDGQGWWFGFDCVYGGDAMFRSGNRRFGEHYWELPEVVRETEHLAEQLAAL